MVYEADQRLSELVQNLKGALEVFRNDQSSGSRLALTAVIEFLRKIDVEPELRNPLYTLLGELEDKNKGDSRKPIKKSLDQAFAAATVDLLMDAGEDLDSALDKVAKATGETLDHDKLKEIRRNLRRSRSRGEARGLYWLVQQVAKGSVDPTPQGRADTALDHVHKLFGTKG